MTIVERVTDIFTPFEGAQAAGRIGNLVQRFIDAELPGPRGRKMIDDLISKHGISGADKAWLENVRDSIRE